MDSIYFDVEKDVTDENITKMFIVFKIILDDIEKFLEIQQRVKTQNKGGPTGAAKRVVT